MDGIIAVAIVGEDRPTRHQRETFHYTLYKLDNGKVRPNHNAMSLYCPSIEAAIEIAENRFSRYLLLSKEEFNAEVARRKRIVEREFQAKRALQLV